MIKVFWLGAIISIVVFFIAVESSGLNLLFLWGLGSVDTNGQGLFIPLASVFPPLPLRPLFVVLLLASFAVLSHGGADFGYLGLSSSERKKFLKL